MIKKFIIGTTIGCLAAVGIVLLFGISNPLLAFVIGMLCGGTSMSFVLLFLD